MNADERAYYESPSKQDSVTAAAWCFIACAILIVLAGLSYLLGGLA